MAKSPISKDERGRPAWVQKEGDQYVVTGVDLKDRRFKITYSTWGMAMAINLWRGSKWLLRDGQRFLIERVYN